MLCQERRLVRDSHSIWVVTLEGNLPLGRELDGTGWGQYPLSGCCEHGNEDFVFYKMLEFLFYQQYHRKACVVDKDIGLNFWLSAVLTHWLVYYIYIKPDCISTCFIVCPKKCVIFIGLRTISDYFPIQH